MNNEFYISIGYTFVWSMKYIFIPLEVAVTARFIADKLLRSQPERQRKKRL